MLIFPTKFSFLWNICQARNERYLGKVRRKLKIEFVKRKKKKIPDIFFSRIVFNWTENKAFLKNEKSQESFGNYFAT